MEIFVQVYRFFDNVAIIVKNVNPLSQKIYCFFVYLHLILKLIIASLTGTKVRKQKIFGRVFHFSDYKEFITLFAEMFFLMPYAFDSESSKPVIIDAGANIGLASFYFKKLFPDSIIIAFEPSKTSFRHLKMNLKGLKGVSLVNAALSDTNRSGFLYFPKKESSYNSSTRNRWNEGEFSKEKTSFVKLSSYIKKYKSIDFVKLDVEGVEENVLKELDKKGLISKIKEMFVEYHNFAGNSLAKTTTILEKNHFKIITYGGIRSPYPPIKGHYWCLSIFAFRDRV